MAGIGFCTPVKYDGQAVYFSQKLAEIFDDYFYLGGRVARVLPESIGNVRQEVVYEEREINFWETTFKIISYFTLVLPLLILILKAQARSLNHYHLCNAPAPQPFYYGDEALVKAPLTLVRAAKPTELEISVSYNRTFEPVQPIEPMPFLIDGKSPVMNYVWRVMTNADGTLTTARNERIKMIWWEAIRHKSIPHTGPHVPASVRRTDLKEFIGKALQKVGVHEREIEAFAHYWSEQFKSDSPFVHVQLVDSSVVEEFVPKMEIKSEETFTLNRFYFLFQPVSHPAHGIYPNAYLSQIKTGELGPNAVIDLGGEIVASVGARRVREAPSADFNNAFIQNYIYA